MTAHLYLRYSTLQQANGISESRQTASARKWCDLNNQKLANVYKDLGKSGFKDSHRQGLDQLLNDINSNTIHQNDYILVENHDRLSRQEVTKALSLLLEIVNTGVNLVTLSDGMIFDNSKDNTTELLVSVVNMSRAHNESHLKSLRQSANMASKLALIKQGIPTSMKLPYWITLNDNQFTLNDNADTIRLIFKLHQEGYGQQRICQHLNELKLPTPQRSAHWQKSAIAKILKSPNTYGTINFKGHTQPDYYPAAISHETYLRSQSITQNRRPTGKPSPVKNKHNLFAGLLRCHHCNKPLRYIHSSKKNPTPRLICSGTGLGICDHNRGINYQLLEARLLATITSIEMPYDIHQQDNSTALQALIGVNQRRIDNLTTALELSDNIPDIVNRIHNLQAEISTLKSQIQSEKIKTLRHPSLKRETLSTIDQYQTRLFVSDRLQQFISKIVLVDLIQPAAVIHFHNGQIRRTFINDSPDEINTVNFDDPTLAESPTEGNAAAV